MLIKQIDRDTEKERIARLILESLPEWFGIPQAREDTLPTAGESPSSVPLRLKGLWGSSI